MKRKIKPRIETSFLVVISRPNHKDHNILKCDWYINCCILLLLISKVVIGQYNRTVGCKRTLAIGQLHRAVIVSALLNPPSTTLISVTIITNSRD